MADAKNRLKDGDITHISLVKRGANGKVPIYKSSDAAPVVEKTVEVCKYDDDQGELYCVVYATEEVDSQGDIASAEEIKKMMETFMKHGRTGNVDRNHDFNVSNDAFVSQSWLIAKNDSHFPDEPEGSWAVVIKLESEELRKQARNGEIGGVSMAGTGTRIPVEKSDGILKVILKEIEGFKKLFKNESEENVTSDQVENSMKEQFGQLQKSMGETIEKSVADAVKPYAEKVDALQKTLEQKDAKNQELEKRVKDAEDKLKKSIQDDGLGGDENIEKSYLQGVM